MIAGVSGVDTFWEWVVFYAAMLGLGILLLMILTMGILALIFLWRLVVDLFRYGL